MTTGASPSPRTEPSDQGLRQTQPGSLDYLTPTNGELTAVGATVLQNNVMGLGRNGTTAYTRDPTDASLVAQRTSGGTDYVFADWLGSTSALFTSATTGASALPRTYTYWPTGNQRATTGTGNTTDIQSAGGHVVNNNLHYGARWYNPTTGTWTQADPSCRSPTCDRPTATRT